MAVLRAAGGFRLVAILAVLAPVSGLAQQSDITPIGFALEIAETRNASGRLGALSLDALFGYSGIVARIPVLVLLGLTYALAMHCRLPFVSLNLMEAVFRERLMVRCTDSRDLVSSPRSRLQPESLETLCVREVEGVLSFIGRQRDVEYIAHDDDVSVLQGSADGRRVVDRRSSSSVCIRR